MKYSTVMISLILALSCSACSEEDVVLTTRDWENTYEYFQSADASHFSTYYQPQAGYVGDPMPFFDPVEKDFKIFYLQEFRPNSATYHPFWCLSTKDGASYTQLGEMIPTGTISELDGALGTGSTIYNETDKTYYTFYTGHSANVALTGIVEGVMLATSSDFKTWKKERGFLLSGAGEYSTNDFRDPFVFKGDDGIFHMVVSTQKDGKGVLAEYTSTDLRKWNSNGVFMSMMWDRFYECPDIFKMGDWWYLVYSEKHAAVRRVQYFKGHTLADLKACTANDAGIWPDSHEGMLDSRAFYAGKTASDGTDRYIWGWCPTRPGKDNTNVGAYPAEPEWAGSLVAHRLIQHADGTLTLGPVKGIMDKYGKKSNLKVAALNGGATSEGGVHKVSGEGSVLFNRLGECNKIEFDVTTSGERFGVSFVRGVDSDKYYTLMFNPEGNGKMKINFEQEGKDGMGFIAGADGYLFDAAADNTYHVTILTDNSVCTMYINDVAAHTSRIYGINKNCWSINSYGGTLTVNNLSVSNQ